MITFAQAIQILQMQNAGHRLTPYDVQNLLSGVRGVTFAGISYATQVKTAAVHRDKIIHKVTQANVQIANNLLSFTSVYANAVRKSAQTFAANLQSNIDEFVPQNNYFEHTPCYSVVRHRQQNKYYLYAIFNSASSRYINNGVELSKQEVAEYMTPSAADKLLNGTRVVENVTHDILHTVQVRTIQLEKIVSIRAMGQTV